MVERTHTREFVPAWVRMCVLCEWTCNAWPCVGVRPHSECCTLGKHPRACVCRIQQPYRVHVRFLLALLIDLHA